MKTPLIDALNALNHDRYHMPGHKGEKPKDFPCAFKIDFTEIDGTGNLYDGDGPIATSEKLALEYFNSNECMYLTCGSTQGLHTAIFSVKAHKMIVDRNSHKSVSNALGLCDIEPLFVNPKIDEEFNIPSKIDPLDILKLLEDNDDIGAVFITSPNYYGITQDIKAISNICKKFNVPLIVDEAHGCHFNAIGVKNAVSEGATIAVTSAHKTTDSLGQGAVLMHDGTIKNIRKNASIFGTTSPSYAILASIEIALANIFDYKDILEEVISLKHFINDNTKFNILFAEDTTRFVINCKNLNANGFEIQEILQKEYNIIPEMADINNVVFIITPRDKNLENLKKSLLEIDKKTKKICVSYEKFEYNEYIRKLSVREAMFSKSEEILLKDAKNRISKEIIAPYPPGVPVIYPGEIILPKHIEFLKKICYNIETKINVI